MHISSNMLNIKCTISQVCHFFSLFVFQIMFFVRKKIMSVKFVLTLKFVNSTMSPKTSKKKLKKVSRTLPFQKPIK